MRNNWQQENIDETTDVIDTLGNEFMTASGRSFNALVDERSSVVSLLFPTAFEDLREAGRIGVLSLDASLFATTLVASMVVTDTRTGVRWKIERIRDDAFGNLLQGRTALVTASPML